MVFFLISNLGVYSKPFQITEYSNGILISYFKKSVKKAYRLTNRPTYQF